MDSIYVLMLAMLAWSFGWFVPATLAGKRRRKGKPIYWVLLLSALIIEVLVAVSTLQLGVIIDITNIFAIAGPLVGALAGGLFYSGSTSRKDIKTANNQLNQDAMKSGGPVS